MANSWVKNLDALKEPPTAHFHEWLTKPYVLSQALKKIATDFHVNVLSQAFERIGQEEYERLGEEDTDTFVRQVFLEGNHEPWTYGRVVIPSEVYQRHFAQFGSLKNKPIGETLLYNNPEVSRSPFEYAALSSCHPLYQAISKHLSLSVPILWARRSLFLMKGDPLLITEVFLPAIPCFPS